MNISFGIGIVNRKSPLFKDNNVPVQKAGRSSLCLAYCTLDLVTRNECRHTFEVINQGIRRVPAPYWAGEMV